MLVKKFLHRYKLVGLGPINEKTHRQEQAIQKIVSSHFQRFIDQQTFTEKNLARFQEELVVKL